MRIWLRDMSCRASLFQVSLQGLFTGRVQTKGEGCQSIGGQCTLSQTVCVFALLYGAALLTANQLVLGTGGMRV